MKAQQMAETLRDDPVMARQIKEHIRPEDLLDLLEIAQPELDLGDVSSEYLLAEIQARLDRS